MTIRNAAMGMMGAAVMGMLAGSLQAAVVAPAKQYVKPDEAVTVKFLDENEQGKKAIAKIGLAATELEGMFEAAKPGDVEKTDGTPQFQVFTLDGKQLEAKGKVEMGADGAVRLDILFPEVKEAGTYVLAWKDAPPLVIETLRTPIPWAGLTDLTMSQKQQVIQQSKLDTPVATHLELLEYAEIKTDKGVIKAKFAYDAAPHTVDNFISLSRQKFYDGSAFHRIISGFMIQGGDSLANMKDRAGKGGPGYSITAEFGEKLHERGVLSMARTPQDVDTAGSQFFIVHQKAPSLDVSYTAFGDVIEGMNVVDEIAKTPVADVNGTVAGEKPKIESVRILPATLEQYGIKK